MTATIATRANLRVDVLGIKDAMTIGNRFAGGANYAQLGDIRLSDSGLKVDAQFNTASSGDGFVRGQLRQHKWSGYLMPAIGHRNVTVPPCVLAGVESLNERRLESYTVRRTTTARPAILSTVCRWTMHGAADSAETLDFWRSPPAVQRCHRRQVVLARANQPPDCTNTQLANAAPQPRLLEHNRRSMKTRPVDAQVVRQSRAISSWRFGNENASCRREQTVRLSAI